MKSTFWGAVDDSSSDPKFVNSDAIPWLRIKFAGFKDGPTGGDRLSGTTFVQRVHTVGGMAPSAGCSLAADLGKKAFVPYETDYFFYEHSSRHGRHDD